MRLRSPPRCTTPLAFAAGPLLLPDLRRQRRGAPRLCAVRHRRGQMQEGEPRCTAVVRKSAPAAALSGDRAAKWPRRRRWCWCRRRCRNHPPAIPRLSSAAEPCQALRRCRVPDRGLHHVQVSTLRRAGRPRGAGWVGLRCHRRLLLRAAARCPPVPPPPPLPAPLTARPVSPLPAPLQHPVWSGRGRLRGVQGPGPLPDLRRRRQQV